MRKLMIIGALGSSLFALGPPAIAQSGGGMHGAMMGGPRMGMMGRLSPDDTNAFVDAHIAALHAGLRLSAEQERLWPPVEDALRNLAQLHVNSMRTMRESRRGLGDDPVATLRGMADRMSQGADAARRLADAAAPLYATLDEGQKRRLRLLTRPMGAAAMGGRRGGMMRGWFGGRDGDDEDER
jgi:hypothetical protein